METVVMSGDNNPFNDPCVADAANLGCETLDYEDAELCDETTRFTTTSADLDIEAAPAAPRDTPTAKHRTKDSVSDTAGAIAGAFIQTVKSLGSGRSGSRPNSPSGGGGSPGGAVPRVADKRADYLKTRERDLEQRELELDERERQVALQEELSVSGAGGVGSLANNWPMKCYTVDRHDIETDIPVEHQRLCKRAYHMWILTMLALTMNLVSVACQMALTTNVVVAPMEHVLWAAIYLVLGVVISWTGWYKGLYAALATGRSIVWLKFWVMFGLHVLYVAYSIVGLPNWSTSGVFNLLADLGPGGSWTVVGLCIANIALWSIVALLSSVVFKSALTAYKAGGGHNKLRSDVRHAMVQEIAVQGVRTHTIGDADDDAYFNSGDDTQLRA